MVVVTTMSLTIGPAAAGTQDRVGVTGNARCTSDGRVEIRWQVTVAGPTAPTGQVRGIEGGVFYGSLEFRPGQQFGASTGFVAFDPSSITAPLAELLPATTSGVSYARGQTGGTVGLDVEVRFRMPPDDRYSSVYGQGVVEIPTCATGATPSSTPATESTAGADVARRVDGRTASAAPRFTG